MALNPVQKWLHSVLGPYRHRQEVYADVDRTLQAVPSLSPRTETYTYDDGRTVLLLTLQGTIPITFRGATYNIPIAYWLPHEYPREAPIAYVVPAPSMLVRQSRSVELSGLIKDDFLQAWTRKWEGNNLLLLTETLQGIFSREPPLYAKPASQPPNGATHSGHPSQPQPQRAPGPRPPPAPPGASASSSSSNSAQSGLHRSPVNHTDRHSSSSPVSMHAQPVASGSVNPGPPMRPQKPWQNMQGSQGPPGAQGQHVRSASISSVHQSLASPVNSGPGPMQPQLQQQQFQQAPMRPPLPQGYEHHRSASMGHASSPSQSHAYQPNQNHLHPRSPQHGSNSASFHPQHANYQPVASTSSSMQPGPSSSPYASTSSIPAQGSRSPSYEIQHGPLHGQNGPSSRLQPAAQLWSTQGSGGPSGNGQDPGISYQTQTPPAPFIPPRPDALRQSTPVQSARPSSRAFTTPVNILDDDDEGPGPSSKGLGTNAPPPRPTNPAMLNLRRALYAQLVHHLNSLQSHLQSENGHLNALHEDLLKGEPAITDEMQRLEAVRDVCASARDRMREVVGAAERNINDLTSRRETEVDELVCGTNVVHNQLLELVAEDNALEDTMYHLGRYFNADTRTQEELEKFLKRTRILAREQFMKRSLINKILLEIAMTRAQRS